MKLKDNPFLAMLRFMWFNAPPRLKYFMLVLALVTGFTRDYVMVVLNKAAAAPINVAISFWLPLFVIALFMVIGCSFAYQLISTMVITSFVNKIRMRMINNLFNVQPAFLDRHEHGSLYHILTTDVSSISGFSRTVLGLVPSIVFLLLAVPQVFSYSIFAGFFALAVMVGGTYSYHLQQKAMSQLNTDARQLDVDYFEGISEMLVGFRELRLHRGRRSSFAGHISSVLERYRAATISLVKIYEIGEVSVNSLKFILFGGVVFLVPYLQHTEASVTFTLLTLVLFCLTPFEQVISSYPSVIGTMVSFQRVSDLDDKLLKHGHLSAKPGATLNELHDISLRGITAVHESREHSNFVLGPVDFDVKAGDVVQLIGSNGSGKTTFMNVLAGLHDFKSGTFSVDGKPLGPEEFVHYRERVSAIFTHYHVFKRMHGLESANGEDLASVLEKVRLQDITGFENGKITRIDLSAGQKRRLALAIALLEDRDILILDEFVADQDPGQREYFFKTLVPALKARGKTLVISTHDLQWTEYCDRLYRFENGQITELKKEAIGVS